MLEDWEDFTSSIQMTKISKKFSRMRGGSDSDFAGDFEDSKSTSGVNLMYLWKSNIRLHLLDVQETNVSFPQFYRVWNHFSGCWIANRWITCSWFMGCGDRSVTFIEQYQNNQPTQQQETVRGITNTNANKKETEMLINCRMCIASPQTQILLKSSLSCTCLKTMKQWSKWSSKGRSPTMRHVSRTHRVALDRFFDRINLDPKIHIKFVDTKNQLADMLTKGKFHTWWKEPSLVYVQHQPFQFHQLSWSDVEKNARRCRWRKSHSKIEADDDFGLAMQREGSRRACFYCIRKPVENHIWKSVTSELVEWAATKNGETCDGR